MEKFSPLQWLALACFTILVASLVIFPHWMRAKYDLYSMNRYASAEGKFSVKIPGSWRHYIPQPPRNDNSYMNVRNDIYSGDDSLRRIMYANMTVVVEELSSRKVAPSAIELGDELNARLAANREAWDKLETRTGIKFPMEGINIKPLDTQFEVVLINGREWAKTTQIFHDEVLIIWQIVDKRMNHYTVRLSTDRIDYYRPIFGKMMRSFSLDY